MISRAEFRCRRIAVIGGKKLLVICSFTEKPVRFDAPDGITLTEQAQVFGNYDANFVISNGFTTRPYEMRVYYFDAQV